MAEFAKAHPCEGDGTVVNLYHFLWKKNKELESCPNIRLPDTIVYEQNFPRAWYWYDQRIGELKRKVGRELDSHSIMREFSDNGSNGECEIVACYYSKVDNRETGKESIFVEYFNKDGLNDFLFRREKKDQGFLQKFVIPKNETNTVIQAIWSPHMTLVEGRSNVHKLNDTRFSMYDRAQTYMGPAHVSTQVFCAPQLISKIKKLCQDVVQHFYSTEHKQIARMVLHFKVDASNQEWFLWASSLRVAHKQLVHKTIPLNLTTTFYSADDPLNAKNTKKDPKRPDGHGAAPSDQFECPNCGASIEGNRFAVPLETLVRYFNETSSAKPFGKTRRSRSQGAVPGRLPPLSQSSPTATTNGAEFGVGNVELQYEQEAGGKKAESGADGDATPHVSFSEGSASGAAGSKDEASPTTTAAKAEDRAKLIAQVREGDDILDDLVYQAYSHVMRSTEPFVFSLPDAAFSKLAEIRPALDKLKITQGSGNSFSLVTEHMSSSKVQTLFQHIKEAFHTASGVAKDELRRDEDALAMSLRGSDKSKSTGPLPPLEPAQPKSIVPPLIRKFLPSVTDEEYRSISKEPLFQGRSFEFCESCFMLFSNVDVFSGEIFKTGERSGRSSLRSRPLSSVLVPLSATKRSQSGSPTKAEAAGL